MQFDVTSGTLYFVAGSTQQQLVCLCLLVAECCVSSRREREGATGELRAFAPDAAQSQQVIADAETETETGMLSDTWEVRQLNRRGQRCDDTDC